MFRFWIGFIGGFVAFPVVCVVVISCLVWWDMVKHRGRKDIAFPNV
jgi:hypothetical protein